MPPGAPALPPVAAPPVPPEDVVPPDEVVPPDDDPPDDVEPLVPPADALSSEPVTLPEQASEAPSAVMLAMRGRAVRRDMGGAIVHGSCHPCRIGINGVSAGVEHGGCATLCQRMTSATPGDPIDFDGLDVSRFDDDLLEAARLVWADRVRTEYQSIQVVSRFLSEALAIGEPLEVTRAVAAMVEEEMRHTDLCSKMCIALGGSPPALIDVVAPAPDLDDVPPRERVTASAISMFLISETFSVGYIRDLAERCRHPVVRRVIAATLDDESDHEEFGWRYVARCLEGEPERRLAQWRDFTHRLVRKHLDPAEAVLEGVPEDKRTLGAWPEPERADLGLLGQERLALLCLRTWNEVLEPEVRELGLATSAV